MDKKLKQQIKNSPQKPGVYLFKNKSGQILYIGKAVNLRNRLKQYLRIETRAPFLEHLLKEAVKVEYKTTNSEIEALILESQLIKKHQPKYNIMLRDDKQYFYVGFTDEEFPKIFMTHRPSQISNSTKLRIYESVRMYKFENSQKFVHSQFIGPFTDGTALKTALRLLRRAFPYCTCKQKHHNFCLNYHIGKCPGFCCFKEQNSNSSQLTINKQLYQKNIKAIKDILSGEKDSLIKKLRRKLRALAKKQEFEKAIDLRSKIEKLERVFENAKIISDANIRIHTNDTNILEEIKRTFKLPRLPHRIEGYDVSNIQGKNAVGAMIVFIDGRPDKNEYRKFKIHWKNQPDDITMLKEMLTRRLNHPEWTYPDLIFIDGGKGQLNVAIKAIAFIATFSETERPAIISLAKGKQEVFSSTLRLRSGQAKPRPMKKLPSSVQNLIRQIDSEAHRFAIGYYRKIHRRALLKIEKRPSSRQLLRRRD